MKAWRLVGLLPMVLFTAGLVHAQDSPSGLRAGGSSFMYARYSTKAASALYAARGFGPVSIVAGAVQNHSSGYREAMLGGLSSITYGSQALTIVVAYTDATDAPYLQIYAMPEISVGAVSASATGLLYQPLDGAGLRQFELNPIMLLGRLSPWFAFGSSYSLGIAAGSASSQLIGMAVRLRAKLGTITAEILHGVERANKELRISFWAGY